MLKEISCDKFIEKGIKRKPIIFNKSLNVVLGTNNASNAIGKSTFLLALDFIFGGKDYLDKNKNKGVFENIGNHTFYFKFEFDNNEFYFSRSTQNHEQVSICTNEYKEKEKIDIEEYKKFLSKKYYLDFTDLTFRTAINPFFRIARKECLNENEPLQQYNAQSFGEQLENLIKIFNEYEKIKDLKKTEKEVKEKRLAFTKASNFDFVQKAKNKTEFTNNAKKIDELEKELSAIAENTKLESQTLDSIKSQKIAQLQTELSTLRRKRTIYSNQKNSLIDLNELHFKESFVTEELKEFFPDVNIDTQRITEIENFHNQLSNILKEEVIQSKNNLDVLIQKKTEEIQQIESKIEEIIEAKNISRVVLLEYSNLAIKKERLESLNKNYLKSQNLKAECTNAEKIVSENSLAILKSLSEKINEKLKFLNNLITPTFNQPEFIVQSENKYLFDVKNDGSTGTDYKKLIFFDLAFLQITNIPCVCHDSLLLKNIEDPVLEQIFDYYSKSQKQIFVAFDKISSYSQKCQEIINNHTILALSDNGGELFGKSLRINK